MPTFLTFFLLELLLVLTRNLHRVDSIEGFAMWGVWTMVILVNIANRWKRTPRQVYYGHTSLTALMFSLLASLLVLGLFIAKLVTSPGIVTALWVASALVLCAANLGTLGAGGRAYEKRKPGMKARTRFFP